MNKDHQPVIFNEEVMSSLEKQSEKSIDFYRSEGVKEECLKCERWRELRFLFHFYGITECTKCIYKNNER